MSYGILHSMQLCYCCWPPTSGVFASGVYGMNVADPIAETADAAIHMNSMCGKGSLTDDSDVEPNLKMAVHTGKQ